MRDDGCETERATRTVWPTAWHVLGATLSGRTIVQALLTTEGCTDGEDARGAGTPSPATTSSMQGCGQRCLIRTHVACALLPAQSCVGFLPHCLGLSAVGRTARCLLPGLLCPTWPARWQTSMAPTLEPDLLGWSLSSAAGGAPLLAD